MEKYSPDALHRPILVVYPGAHHSFESKRPAQVHFGYKLACDPKATAGVLERTGKFLDAYLRH